MHDRRSAQVLAEADVALAERVCGPAGEPPGTGDRVARRARLHDLEPEPLGLVQVRAGDEDPHVEFVQEQLPRPQIPDVGVVAAQQDDAGTGA